MGRMHARGKRSDALIKTHEYRSWAAQVISIIAMLSLGGACRLFCGGGEGRKCHQRACPAGIIKISVAVSTPEIGVCELRKADAISPLTSDQYLLSTLPFRRHPGGGSTRHSNQRPANDAGRAIETMKADAEEVGAEMAV